MRDIFPIGTEVTLSAVFEDPATEEAVAPETVECFVRTGDHRILEPEVTEGEAEDYEATVSIDVPGFWAFRFLGSGGYSSAAEATFEVPDLLVAP